MKQFSLLKRVVAFGLLTAGIAGCGGHGGGSGGSRNATPAAVFKDVELKGDLDAPNRAGGTTASFRISTNEGVASFYKGTMGSASFLTYSADIKNVAYVSDEPTKTPGAITGTINFDLQNFTSGSPYQSPMHYTGTFAFTGSGSSLALTFTGKLTGTDIHGSAVNATLNPVGIPLVQKYDLSGKYKGSIDISGSSTPWTGTLTQSDELHLDAAISASPLTISFNGTNVKNSFAGEFDGSQVGFPGAKGLWYVESTDGSSLTGAYVVIDAASGIGVVGGKITATRDTGSTTGAALPKGFYNGTLTKGGTTGKPFYLDVLKSTSTVGLNGGAIVRSGSTTSPDSGGRVVSVSGSGDNIVVTIQNFTATSGYTQIVLTGGNLSGHFFGEYTATTTAGTETGTFDTTLVATPFHPSLAGNFEGVLDSDNPLGNHTDYTAHITQTGDEVTIDTSATAYGSGTISIKGYYVGGTFVGISTNTIASPAGTVKGIFSGDVRGDGSGFDGRFRYEATFGTATQTDTGSFAGSKV